MVLLKNILPKHIERLDKAGIPRPDQSAEAIWSYLLNLPSINIQPFLGTDIASLLEKAEDLLKRREKFEPLERLFEGMLYMGMRIHLRNGVFRPLPAETEAMINFILHLFENKKNEPIRILDLGTGTGCLLLKLLNELPKSTGVGIDLHEDILKTARENARENNLCDRAQFKVGNWGKGLSEKFDLVISNPPAVFTKEMGKISPEMSLYDPIESLDGGLDGLDCYRGIAQDLGSILTENGMAIIYAYSMDQEASIFRKRGFAVETIVNFYNVPYSIVIKHEEKKRFSFFNKKRR